MAPKSPSCCFLKLLAKLELKHQFQHGMLSALHVQRVTNVRVRMCHLSFAALASPLLQTTDILATQEHLMT